MILRLSPYTWEGDAEKRFGGGAMVRIQFQSIHIDDIVDNASVNKGTNQISGRRHSAKTNQGLGAVNGFRNIIIGGNHAVHDRDTFDFQPHKRKS